MAVRKLKEGKTLKNYEIADMLVANGFGNEEEGYLDYFLDNPKYCASVNLDDMGAYVDDYDRGEQIELPYANGATRKILRTKEDVDEFLDFIADLENERYLESKTCKTGNKRSIKEDIGDQGWYLKRVENYKDFCRRMTKLANSVESLYGDIGKYLEQANLSKSYLDRIGKLNADILDAWSHIDQAEVVASDLIKDMETFIEL